MAGGLAYSRVDISLPWSPTHLAEFLDVRSSSSLQSCHVLPQGCHLRLAGCHCRQQLLASRQQRCQAALVGFKTGQRLLLLACLRASCSCCLLLAPDGG